MLREAVSTLRNARKGVDSSTYCTCLCLVCHNISDNTCCAHLKKFDGVTKLTKFDGNKLYVQKGDKRTSIN